MLSFEKEIERLVPLMNRDTDEAYSFLAPLLIPAEEKRDIVLYAVGQTCERVYRYLKRRRVSISAVCDKNKRGAFLDSGLTIISPEELYLKYQDAWIVVCTFNFSVDVISTLCESGIPERNILRATYSSNIAYFCKEDFFSDTKLYDGYKYAYDLAHDDTSKGVVLDVLRKDMSGTHYLTKTSKLPAELQYFNFPFGSKEIFVQAGCYIGDTVDAFIKFRNNNPNDVIYTFEVDEQNYEIAQKNLKKYKNVNLFQLGLWDKEDTLFFNDTHGPRSRVVNFALDGGTSIKVIALDDLFAGKSELPTFIELDIEGSEPQALLGARNILKKAKPKLAVCVYHYYDHLYTIPRIIQQINPNYKRFRFVQTMDNSLSDTVLFVD